ncbi:unnamed protein product [Trichogramma brassicae]|uniref:C2H2-type domain-containing protein n=1 Tax=Trichogramma brassicae TaxID=86971 RepID=A0A6H5ILD3_9HYME|nr:unnamed protein product [Trichogramma brassicae]
MTCKGVYPSGLAKLGSAQRLSSISARLYIVIVQSHVQPCVTLAVPGIYLDRPPKLVADSLATIDAIFLCGTARYTANVHEGRKNFACDKCERKYRSKLDLSRHQKSVHEGCKDYGCDRYDVNYVDELGFSHFHAACKVGHYLAAKKFLESGQDLNCIMPETGDSPLHLAVRSPFGNESQELNRFLLESGANPNLPNAHGLTPLHNACQRPLAWTSYYLMQTLFEHSIDEYQPLQVDAQDKWGNTPLHYLLSQISACVDLEILLTKGPNPNFVNKNGSTPLHIICKKNQLFYEENLSKVFFKIYSDMQQTIQAFDKTIDSAQSWSRGSPIPRQRRTYTSL